MLNINVINCYFVGLRDYCQFEAFDASCGQDEVILMNAARYGRMHVGRCVARDYGYITCAADVMDEMDKRCSGRRQCHFNIPSLRDSFQPCPKDLTAYLEASHSCVKSKSLLFLYRLDKLILYDTSNNPPSMMVFKF